jgi:hypothetical protein
MRTAQQIIADFYKRPTPPLEDGIKVQEYILEAKADIKKLQKIWGEAKGKEQSSLIAEFAYPVIMVYEWCAKNNITLSPYPTLTDDKNFFKDLLQQLTTDTGHTIYTRTSEHVSLYINPDILQAVIKHSTDKDQKAKWITTYFNCIAGCLQSNLDDSDHYKLNNIEAFFNCVSYLDNKALAGLAAQNNQKESAFFTLLDEMDYKKYSEDFISAFKEDLTPEKYIITLEILRKFLPAGQKSGLFGFTGKTEKEILLQKLEALVTNKDALQDLYMPLLLWSAFTA